MAGNGNEKQCESFRESVASMANGNGKGKGWETLTARPVLNWQRVGAAGRSVPDPAGGGRSGWRSGRGRPDRWPFVPGVVVDGRARHFVFIRESPGVIVMVFCS